jgi:hypothetical protein
MPGASKLLSAYKLGSVARKLGLSYTAPTKDEHPTSQEYHYTYHYVLVLSPKSGGSSPSTAAVRSALKAAVSTDRKVASHYGNMYHCRLAVKSVSKSSGGAFRVTLSGLSHRE